MKIKVTEEVWKEGNMYVSYCPELDMAACGKSIEESKKNLKEVISINFVECRKWEPSMNYCKMPDLLKIRITCCWPEKNWSVFLPLNLVSDVSNQANNVSGSSQDF